VTVTVRLEDLERRAASASLEFGGQLTPQTLRQLACDAAVIPVVLDGTGVPLDVGRISRTVPDGLRRAVTVRDGGCAFPGCDRPPSWCDIHPVKEWQHGGPTTLGNLAMLCAVHHRLVHHSLWEIRMVDGRPEFIPPSWIDRSRTPRRKPPPLLQPVG
jgi:5-methylcytosine-specific restriction protein A